MSGYDFDFDFYRDADSDRGVQAPLPNNLSTRPCPT
jgi:hypothetical protein